MAKVIYTHPNADFDAIAALLAAHKLYPDAIPILSHRMNRSVEDFVTLYQNGLPFADPRTFKPEKLDQVILVDTQRPPTLKTITKETPIFIIDHHPRSDTLDDNMTFTGEEVGATVTLLVEQMREAGITVNSLEATLMMLGIYSDTGSLSYGSTTPRDIDAAAWLLRQNALMDTVRRFLSAPLDDSQVDLFDRLMQAAETRFIQGFSIVVSAVEVKHYVDQVNSVTHRLRDMLDPDAIFVLVRMSGSVQMVIRSLHDAIDAGEVARRFGGGGHTRAAAAKVRRMRIEQVIASLWNLLEQTIQPATQVADLMSYGVQTVDADAAITDIITQLRRIGHEGYPVLEHGRVVGLLTRRDADRALEHGLDNVRVRQIMHGGEITLSPYDSVNTFEQVMVESGWGQIPVVDYDDNLIGIVTRTDLIKHWAKVHPATLPPDDRIQQDQLTSILGKSVTMLIETIAQFARQKETSIYMVGGIVRDLLLARPNYDIDFVVEGDAIALAEALCERYGGEVTSFRPFGTAKWRLDKAITKKVKLRFADLPEHIDFATSRNEFYEHPTALPSVYDSSIKLDLHRRDFTINTLAVQLSPEPLAYRLLDFYGGMADLKNGVIRVLHSLSFVDDPTRVLRAVRFEQRLDFTIEARTAELIESALPMLQRITGERLRNELTLLLKEAQPEKGLTALQEREILSAIHPAFHYPPSLSAMISQIRQGQSTWLIPVEDPTDIYWHVLMMHLPLEVLPEIGERLLFGKSIMESFIQAATLMQQPGDLIKRDLPPSQVIQHLEGVDKRALLAVWLCIDDKDEDPRQAYIEHYWREWQHIKTATTGNTLKEMGLSPGPHYKTILNRLREARLDGEVRDDEAERLLLEKIVREQNYDDPG